MMKFTKRDKRTEIEKEIERVIAQMGMLDASSKRYSDMAKNLETLYKAQGYDNKRVMSADTKALIATNLGGILLILTFEKTNVIATKALGFIIKGRV